LKRSGNIGFCAQEEIGTFCNFVQTINTSSKN
jgi:hypothetical protein